MPRKFLYSLHALVSNYSSNQITHLLRDSLGAWTVTGNITAGSDSNNLVSIAANIQGSRVIFANYPLGEIVPLNFAGGVWSPGTPVASGGGNTSAVTMSDDGLHALSSGDFTSAVTPYEFNVGTGLWVAGTPVATGSTHLNSVRMTRDGSRAIVVPKYDDIAYPLARNPGTGLWSVGTGIAVASASERFFSVGFSIDGDVAIVGSNAAGVSSDGLIWNGSTWSKVSVPAAMNSAVWRPDGLSAIGGNAAGEAGCLRVVHYDPIGHTFTAGQVITDFTSGAVVSVALANDGIGDVGLAADFNHNQLTPLTYSRSTGLWTAGTVIASELFSRPWNMLIFPVW